MCYSGGYGWWTGSYGGHNHFYQDWKVWSKVRHLLLFCFFSETVFNVICTLIEPLRITTVTTQYRFRHPKVLSCCLWRGIWKGERSLWTHQLRCVPPWWQEVGAQTYRKGLCWNAIQSLTWAPWLTRLLAPFVLDAVTAAEERTDTLGFTTLTHSTSTLSWKHKPCAVWTPTSSTCVKHCPVRTKGPFTKTFPLRPHYLLRTQINLENISNINLYSSQ